MTLPEIQGMFRYWDDYTPTALIAAAFRAGSKPKPLTDGLAGIGVPVRKGKVNRGDVGR